MNKYGMMIVCGNSIEELEHELAMLKMAVATGAMMGCGGATLANVEKEMTMLGGNPPTAMSCPHCNGWGCGFCDPETYKNEDEYVDENTTPPTIIDILDMVETGEIDSDEAYALIHEYYEVED